MYKIDTHSVESNLTITQLSNDEYFTFRQQSISEKESAEKLRLYSQQQAKRASNAEVSIIIVNM